GSVARECHLRSRLDRRHFPGLREPVALRVDPVVRCPRGPTSPSGDARPPLWAEGSVAALLYAMSATLPNRDGRLPAFLLAALFALALGSPEAWPAVRSGGGGAVHAGVPRSGFVARRFAGRRFGDRFARGR